MITSASGRGFRPVGWSGGRVFGRVPAASDPAARMLRWSAISGKRDAADSRTDRKRMSGRDQVCG